MTDGNNIIDDSDVIETVPRKPGKPGRPRKEATGVNRNRRLPRTAPAEAPRAPMRAESREDARAPRTERLTRTSRADKADQFYVNPRQIPHNTSYEWKRKSSYGAEDGVHQIELRENHWRPVPASRHPELVADGVTAGPVERGGMILMERPLYLTREAQQEDYQEAQDLVNGNKRKITESPSGQFSREHPQARNVSGIKRSYEPLPISD